MPLCRCFLGALFIIDRWEGSVDQCMMGSPVLLATVTSKFTGKIFGFPPDTTEEGLIERKRWLEALPNYVNPAKITCSVGICEKHWKPGFEYKVVQNGTRKPIHPIRPRNSGRR